MEWPKTGNNPLAHQQVAGEANCDLPTQRLLLVSNKKAGAGFEDVQQRGQISKQVE